MEIYLYCAPDREEAFRYLLEDLPVHALTREQLPQPSPGDIVLVDFVNDGADWTNRLEILRRVLQEGVCLVGVLEKRQLRALGKPGFLNDFAVEGCTAEELKARLRWHTAESVQEGEPPELEIDEDRYEARLAGAPIELTFKEFELLRFLAARPGKVFTREMLLEQLWGYDYFGGARTVDVHIRRIRSKIEHEGRVYIRTVRGVGYIFEP